MRDLPNRGESQRTIVAPKIALLKIRQASRKRQSGDKGRG
jgi:hypothetical protein